MNDRFPETPNGFSPKGNLKTIPGEIDVPGPVKRSNKAVPDDLGAPVKSSKDKKKKGEEMKNRLVTISEQLYGHEIHDEAVNYADFAVDHELKHATAVKKPFSFGLAAKGTAENSDIYPNVRPTKKLSPWETKKVAEAVGKENMSREDTHLRDKAQKQIDVIKRRLILTAAIVGTPLCGALYYIATHPSIISSSISR